VNENTSFKLKYSFTYLSRSLVYHQKEGDPELKIVGRWAWLGERFSPANGAIGTTQDPGD
jgi:hypothetical protein